MRPALRDAEIGPLADHLRADLLGRNADRIIGAVAHLRIGFAGGAHIGADAAEPEKVDLGLEDRCHDFERRRLGLVEADGCGGLRGQDDRFFAAGNDHPARGETRAVIVLPARAWQGEQTLPFCKG